MVFKCDKCGKIFDIKGDYDRHINRKKLCTLKITTYKCNLCGQLFNHMGNYNKHIRRITPCVSNVGARKSWYRHGKEHRENAPATIWYKTAKFEVKIQEVWMWHGYMHRTGGLPAFIEYGDNEVAKFEAWYEDGKFIKQRTYSRDHIIERWYSNDVLHREDGPAFITYDKDGTKKREKWYKDDKIHREDGPAWIEYYENENKKEERWFKDDKMHKEDGPAWIDYYENGNKKKEWWFKDDMMHRENEPAKITYYCSGQKESELWYNDNTQHRENEPAKITYYENGNKESETWYETGQHHREDGPAKITYSENGNKKTESIYVGGYLHSVNDKAAYIEYNENGSKSLEKWLRYDERHRDNDLPTFIKYFQDGTKWTEKWQTSKTCRKEIVYHKSGKKFSLCYYDTDGLHNYPDPAKIIYHKDGVNKKSEHWYLNGVPDRSNPALPVAIWYDEIGRTTKFRRKFMPSQNSFVSPRRIATFIDPQHFIRLIAES